MIRLSDEELNKIRQSLRGRRSRLSSAKRLLEVEALQPPDGTRHPTDAGDLSATQNVDLALASAESREIQEITRALAKISSNQYGICERCGDDIPKERLIAVPAAPFCMNCERLLERRRHLRKKPNDTSPYLSPLEDEQEIPY